MESIFADVMKSDGMAMQGYNLSESFMTYNMSPLVLNTMLDKAMEMDAFRSDHKEMDLWRNLPHVIHAFADSLFDKHGDLLRQLDTSENFNVLTQTVEDFYTNFTFNQIRPIDTIRYEELLEVLCIPFHYFSSSDLKMVAGTPPPEKLYYSTCRFKALYDLGSAKDTYEKVTKLISYDHIYSVFDMLSFLVMLFSFLYIIVDLFERLVYIYTRVSSHTHVSDMILSLISKKFPGSYLRKQLNILTSFSILIYYSLVITTRNMVPFLLVIGMVFRLSMHIHSM